MARDEEEGTMIDSSRRRLFHDRRPFDDDGGNADADADADADATADPSSSSSSASFSPGRNDQRNEKEESDNLYDRDLFTSNSFNPLSVSSDDIFAHTTTAAGMGMDYDDNKYDDDELREIAAALIPDVSELLSDAALERLLRGDEVGAEDESDSDSESDSDDDGGEYSGDGHSDNYDHECDDTGDDGEDEEGEDNERRANKSRKAPQAKDDESDDDDDENENNDGSVSGGGGGRRTYRRRHDRRAVRGKGEELVEEREDEGWKKPLRNHRRRRHPSSLSLTSSTATPSGGEESGARKNRRHRHHHQNEEDDGLQRELLRLAAAEDSLREELDMAGGFGEWMRSNSSYPPPPLTASQPQTPEDYDRNRNRTNRPPPSPSPQPPTPEPSSTTFGFTRPSKSGYVAQTKDERAAVEAVRMKRSLLDDEDNDEGDGEERGIGSKGHPPDDAKGFVPRRPRPYTLSDHADVLRVEALHADVGHITAPLLSRSDVESIFVVPSMPSFCPNEFATAASNAEGRGGFGLGEIWIGDTPPSEDGGAGTGTMAKTLAKKYASGSDEEREEYVRLMMDCAREYVKSMTSAELRKIYVGLVPATDVARGGRFASSAPRRSLRKAREERAESHRGAEGRRGDDDDDDDGNNDDVEDDSEPIPVRTVAIRIRPDVLCGAVMDALSHAVENVGGEMTKRQGGHLRAVLPGYWLSPRRMDAGVRGGDCDDDYEYDADGSAMDSVSSGLASLMTFSPDGHVGKKGVSRRAKARMRMMPPILVDAQLCARKRSRECERVLLVRAYRVGGSGTAGAAWEGRDAGPVTCNTFTDCDAVVEEDDDGGISGTLIREAASLVQRMDAEGVDSSPVVTRSSSTAADPSSGGRSGLSQIGNILTSPLRLITGGTTKSTNVACSAPNESASSVFPDSFSATEAVSSHLLQNFQPTLSVESPARCRDKTIPSLSEGDWPFVQSAWRFLKECLNELDNRDLAYSTISSCSFGAFPALPTLDVQYCSQLRLLCREIMILSLLKSASELEQYARESEYQCANLIQLLRPTFESYELTPPALPTPVPLTAYPLDFQAPEAACPPWGQRVMEVMNRVAAMSSMDNSHSSEAYREEASPVDMISSAEGSSPALSKRLNKFKLAKEAVSLVVQAFQRQADEEQSARMGRKNIQVMDRLAKMQAHKRSSIITVRDSYGCNPTITKAADDFHSKANQVVEKPGGDDTDLFFAESDQVPLLTCGILVGGTTGTCYITAHQILFATKVIPLVGSDRCWLFSVKKVEVRVVEPSSSVLNPLPAGLVVYETNEEDEISTGSGNSFSFIPSITAHRLKAFIDVVKAVSTEDPEALDFSTTGGLLYMFEEKKSIARSAMGVTG